MVERNSQHQIAEKYRECVCVCVIIGVEEKQLVNVNMMNNVALCEGLCFFVLASQRRRNDQATLSLTHR